MNLKGHKNPDVRHKKQEVKKVRSKKACAYIFAIFLFISVFTGRAQAQQEHPGQRYFNDLETIIPQDIQKQLPDNLLGKDESTTAKTVSDLVGFDYLSAAALDALTGSLKSVMGSLSLVLGIIIIASVFNLFKGSIRNSGLSRVIEITCGICVALSIFKIMESQLAAASEAISRMNAFMSSMLPIMGGLYAAGGNISTAAASSAGLMTFVTVIENICCYALFPLLRICFGFAIVSVLCTDINMSEVSKLLKKIYAVVIVFLTTLMSGVLAFQSTIANGVDSVAAKTAKFAVGSFVPVVGSALGDAVKTVAGSLSLIKNSVGIIAVVVIILMALPALFTLLMGKLTLGVSGAVAGLLGCERDSKLIEDLKGIYNLGLAMIACTSVLFLVSLTLFIKCALALGA